MSLIKILVPFPFAFLLCLSPLVVAQSVGPIPLERLKVFDVAKRIDAPNGFQIFNGAGELIKQVDEPQQVTVKAVVEHAGSVFLMSDWSFDRLQGQGIAPNWILIIGLDLGNQPPPDEVPVDEQTGSPLYQILFPDANDAQAPILSTAANSELIYADEEWIVVGSFVRDQGNSGYHYLSAYDAATLRIAFQLNMYNYVFCMDWSPKRRQFLALTNNRTEYGRFVKHPEDKPSLVVIDLSSRQIKRLNYRVESTGRASWVGNRIEVEHNGEETISEFPPRFNGNSFSDILIRATRVKSIPSLASRRKEYERVAALEAVGLSGFSDTPFDGDAGITLDLSRGEDGALRILRTTELGHAIDLNLGDLRMKRHGDGLRRISELSLMDGGIVGLKVGPTTAQFVDSGKVTEVDYGKYWTEESKFGFSHDAAVLIGPDSRNSKALKLTRIRPDGQVTQVSVDISWHDFYNWTLHPNRESIVSLEFSGGQLWREISWDTGKQVGQLYTTNMAKGFGGRGRVFGQSEGDWELTSSIYDINTDSYHYTVVPSNRITGKSVSLDGQKYLDINGDDPLHLFHASPNGFSVVCAGAHKVYLYRYKASEDRATLVKEWDKDPAHGNAAFDREGSRLFVPRDNGYEVFAIEKNDVRKAFDLYFYGDSEFAVILPNGYYAGSPGCEKFLSLLSEGKNIGASPLALWRNRPGKVMAALGGSQEDVSALEQVTERWLARHHFKESKEPTPPDLPKILLRESVPLRTSQSELNIPCRVFVGSAPLRNVSISVNGVEVKGAKPGWPGSNFTNLQRGEHWDGAMSIPLSSGQNWIELTAADVEGRTGEPVRFRIICVGKPMQPNSTLLIS